MPPTSSGLSADGLDGDPSRRVTFPARRRPGHYNEFRGKMQNLLDSTLT